MKSITIALCRENGVAIQLHTLLALVEENDWTWSVLEFEGVGQAPYNLWMSDFEDMLIESKKGAIMSWCEINKFATNIEQTYWCIVIATLSADEIVKPTGPEFVPNNCLFAFEAFDSTEWTVWSDDAKIIDAAANIQGARILKRSGSTD